MKVINRLKNRYWSVFKEVWNICSNPNQSLKRDVLLGAFDGKNILNSYIFPMAEILLVLEFATNIFISGEWQLANAVVRSMFRGISFVTSYGLLFLLLRAINRQLFKVDITNREVEIMEASLLSITFAVQLLQMVFYNWFFLFFFYLYILYLVWVLSDELVIIEEDKKNKYMVIISSIVIAVPLLMMKIMTLMVPNLVK